MTSPFINPTQDVAIEGVARAWMQENREKFVWTKLPKATVLGKYHNFSNTTSYNLASLDQFLAKTNGQDWDPGDDIPPAKQYGEVSISLTLQGKATFPRVVVLPAPGTSREKNRWADARSNIPGLLGELWQMRERALYDLLVTNATFGNGAGGALAFTGSAALDTRDAAGDHQPIRDVETQMNSIRLWAFGTGFSAAAIMSSRTCDILRSHPDYHGAGMGSGTATGGSGSGTPGILAKDAFLEVFKSTHRLDEVHVIESVVDSVKLGQTSSPTYTAAANFLWLGILDRRQSTWDLTTSSANADLNPDGALVLAEEFEPFVDREEYKLKSVEEWMGKDNRVFYSPRGGNPTTFGRCFTGSIST